MNTKTTVSSTDIKTYHDFCTRHNIRAYSMIDLALRMNITMNQLRYSLLGMIEYFPIEFREFHVSEELALKQIDKVS